MAIKIINILRKSIFSLLLFFIIYNVCVSRSFAMFAEEDGEPSSTGRTYSSSGEEEEYAQEAEQRTLSPEEIVKQYIQETRKMHRKPEKLIPTGTPLIISDRAQLDFERYNRSVRVIQRRDHELHYLMGSINTEVYRRVKVSNINYLILALEVLFIEETPDGHQFRRTLQPILYDYSTGSFTLRSNENTAYSVFLSYSKDRKKDHKKVTNLSETQPFKIQDIQGIERDVYFYPLKLTQGSSEYDFMQRTFSQLGENADSEVHAVYALLQSPHLVESFISSIGNAKRFLSIGMRYYSFLDMCERCQAFLEYNQDVLRPLFMGSLSQHPTYSLGGTPPNLPFLVVSHSNRIYRNNRYIRGDAEVEPVSEKDYPYAVSGGSAGRFIPQDLPQFSGLIQPVSGSVNRLVSFIHEPDLGDEFDLGIIRQYFTHLTDADFSALSLQDVEGSTLVSKLYRVNPLKLKKIDLSENSLGLVVPEFGDDPISITHGHEIAEVLEMLTEARNLEELNLSGNCLSSFHPLQALRVSLPHLRLLRVLNLSDISLDRSEFERIVDSLKELNRLEVLNLDKNFLGYEGATHLANLLRTWLQLQQLRIAYTALCHRDDRECPDDPQTYAHDSGAFLELAQAISQHPTLSLVDVSYYIDRHGPLIKPKDLRSFSEIVDVTGRVQVVQENKKFIPRNPDWED